MTGAPRLAPAELAGASAYAEGERLNYLRNRPGHYRDASRAGVRAHTAYLAYLHNAGPRPMPGAYSDPDGRLTGVSSES